MAYITRIVTVHASFLASRASNTTQDPLLYVGVVGLLILISTLWVAVKRCPLFMKGGIVAIIALFLSLFVSVAPVVADSPTFGAIDAPSIELAHTTPNVPEIFIRDYQTAPQLRKLRTGEWATCGGIHSGLFAGACGWWPSGSSPHLLFGAVVAITAIAASFVPHQGMEGVAMAALGSFFTFTPEGQEDAMSVVTTRGRVLQHCKQTGIVSRVETKNLAGNTFDFIMKSLDRQDVFSADIKTKLDRKAVQAAFPGSLVLQGKRNNFVVIFGMSVEEYTAFLDTEITSKLGLKYQMGLFARVTGAGHSTPKLDIIDLPSGGDGDGILRYSDTEQLLQLRVALGDDITNIRAKIWHAEHGLIKGLFVLVKDPSVDCLTIETCLEDNQKGCLQGPSLALGVDAIVHAWTQVARPKAKAANTSPMMLAQLGQASYDSCVPAAQASLEEDANRMIDAILHGTMDEAMFEGTGGDVSNQIIARDELRGLLNQAELPVASFGSLLRYLKPLIENWKGDLSSLKKACEKRAVAFRMPHSSISVVLSEGTFRRYCELTKPGKFVSFADRGITSMFSDSIRMTVVCEEYYDRMVENKFWDIGDNDGDTHVNAAIEVDGVETSLVHRWPAGAGDFDLLEPKRVDVPLHNKSARRLDGSIVELEPLNFSGDTDCITLADIEVHEDEHLPHGKLTADNFEDWQDTLEKNVDAAFKIGTYALLQTSLMSHDKEAELPRCEFVVDGDIQGTSCVATSKEVDEAMKPAMTAFNEGDIVDSSMFAWARMGLNNYTLDPREAKKKVLLRGVEGSFSRLAKAMVTKRNECAKWLRDRYAEILKGGQRNSQAIIAACEAAGLVADLNKGQRGVAYVNAGNSLDLLRRLDEMDAKEAAEAVYSMYLYIDGQKGMFDSALFHCPADYPGTKYQTLAAYLVAYLIDNDDDNNPTPPDGGGDNPKKGDDMDNNPAPPSQNDDAQFDEDEFFWDVKWCNLYQSFSLVPMPHGGLELNTGVNCEHGQALVEKLAGELNSGKKAEWLEDLMYVLSEHQEKLADMLIDEKGGYMDEEGDIVPPGQPWSLIDWLIVNSNDDDNNDDDPTPPNGGGDNPKKEEAQMSKATNAAIAEWAENGKVVQLKQAKNGKYFFVVDGTTKWIPKSLLSEEDSKDLNKVRAVYKSGRDMFNKGVVGTLFKSLGLAALLFAALFGLDAQEGSVAMCASVCFLTQEWDKVWSRVLRSMKHLRGAEMEYDRVVSCGCPEEEIQDKAGMVALYQSQIDKGFEALEEVEHAMDNKELAEVRGSEYQSKQVKAKWPTKCGTQKGHWIATHPECRPNRCNRAYEPNIGRKAPLKVWWK